MAIIISFIIGVACCILYFYVFNKKSAARLQELQQLSNDKQKLETEYDYLKAKKHEITQEISNVFIAYNVALSNAQEAFDIQIEKASQEVQLAQKKLEQDYLDLAEECVQDFNIKINEKQTLLQELDNKLASLRTTIETAIKLNKLKNEEENKQDFYRMTLSSEDLQEISRLREVLPYLRDKEPLNKVIYKVYYEKPYNDLIHRILGKKTYCGIYKITNLKNQMCYIGQSTNIAERWRQHIKRGVGAEPPTHSKLYPAMLEEGIENFTFEIVEECDRSLLNEREKFWTDFFHAQDYGYCTRKG